MRRAVLPWLGPACALALLLSCYRAVLFGGEQFGFRDASQYYYPLYQRVQAEWGAGRVPLWEPGENAGAPLLADPTAAVLYPGKIVYAVLPYPWAARLYVVAHTALACVAMGALMRSWRASPTASALSALAYGFGAPILFQSCNVIYLVGAAWAPLGFRAADRWLRLGRRWGLLELAVVLALMTLGGDPESAYLVGVCAGGYALGLSWPEGRGGRPRPPGRGRGPVWAAVAAGLAVAWTTGTLELDRRAPALRPPRVNYLTPSALPGMAWVPAAVAVAWAALGLVVLAGRRRGEGARTLAPRLLGLAASAALAAALAGALLVPAFEFARQTSRLVAESHDVYPFSLEPVRLIELAWPNVFGSRLEVNRSWLEATRPAGSSVRVWIPSLYLGGLTLILAVGAIGGRGGGPGRGWLTAVALVSLVASLGEYTGPLWWARLDPDAAARLGPHDPMGTSAIRMDGRLRDGDGGVYWLLTVVLPGFRQFRFPSKLAGLAALALAGLAGLGWDRLSAGVGRRRTAAFAAALLAIGLLALAATSLEHRRIVAALRASPAARPTTVAGPFDAEGAFGELRRALARGAIVSAVALALAATARRRPEAAGALALVVMSADLALANARCVLTVPQAVLDATPKALRIIEAAERQAARDGDSPPGPFRVHRMPTWSPHAWDLASSASRVAEVVAWERGTLAPLHGLPEGVQYTLARGAVEVHDYQWFFDEFFSRLDPATADLLGASPGQRAVVYPRRAFDLWNSRYFVVPGHPNGWADPLRGYASFVEDTERLYPLPGAFDGPGGAARRREWLDREDFLVFRNLAAYPRAWVVHGARFHEPLESLDRARRRALLMEVVYAAHPLWYEPARPVYDPRATAWLDASARPRLARYLDGRPPLPSERATIARHEPQRVELDVTLARPGVVVLADLFYPGWRLTIDGAEAPIERVDLMMRGAAVREGRHRLVFRYDPPSFRAGVGLSLAGLVTLAAFGVLCALRPASPSLDDAGTGVASC